MGEFVLYKEFLSEGDAKILLNILDENNIPFSIVDNAYSVDITFGGSEQRNFQVLIHPDNFGRVNSLLESDAEKLITTIDSDHYLFSFSNEELYEVLLNKDEWSATDYVLAQRILKERGEKITNDDIANFNQQRINQLSQPEKSPTLQIFAGYIFATLGGIIGLLIGWYLWNSKKTLPSGEKNYTYQESDRKNGKAIFLLSIAGIIFWCVVLSWGK